MGGRSSHPQRWRRSRVATAIASHPSTSQRKPIRMQINIDGRSIVRVLAVGAATIGVGAATFFGGQSTRIDDTAVASVKTQAVDKAVKEVETAHATELAIFPARPAGERSAVREARRQTRRNERHRADKLATDARNEGSPPATAPGSPPVMRSARKRARRKASRKRPTSSTAPTTRSSTCRPAPPSRTTTTTTRTTRTITTPGRPGVLTSRLRTFMGALAGGQMPLDAAPESNPNRERP